MSEQMTMAEARKRCLALGITPGRSIAECVKRLAAYKPAWLTEYYRQIRRVEHLTGCSSALGVVMAAARMTPRLMVRDAIVRFYRMQAWKARAEQMRLRGASPDMIAGAREHDMRSTPHGG